MASNHIFKVIFVNQGKVYEVYARKVSHGSLFGFVEIEELVFGERSSVVLDPGEERLKSEFAGVKRSYLPLQSIIRIDEVRKQGVSKIVALEGSNVAQFPVPLCRRRRAIRGPRRLDAQAAGFAALSHFESPDCSRACRRSSPAVARAQAQFLHFVDCARELRCA